MRIAHRMLGTRADAEDALQECWLRWNSARQESIQNPAAWLGTVTTRICVDQIRSVESKRFDYIGPWLPEPAVAANDLADSLSYAFLVLLQTLSPPERCVLLLRDVLGYEFREIAEVLETREAHCRKLLERARKQIAAGRARQRADRKRIRELLERFDAACRTGDSGALVNLLAEDARLRTDGGGKVRSALNPIYGAEHITRFFLGIMKKIPEGVTSEFTMRFGEPAIESHYADGSLQSVLFIEPARDGEAIQEVFIIANPDKLPA
ncbi:MAG: RNA polymerase sigma factor SigJ [Acidobacteria bacterium]|nr:RNA polymerase sigma factor SigJ [Acidobacteriota bacterium]